MNDSIGDRMKRYENVNRYALVPKTPVIVRVDGRAFHTWTKGMEEPFDSTLACSMLQAADQLAGDMQGFKIGYHQSDEVSFLLSDFDRHESQAWFDGNLQKIASVAASVFTAAFNSYWKGTDKPLAYFDARAFNVPREDVSNYFLWRAKDWERNSVSMYCLSHFSHKQMHGKGKADQHEMLHGVGKNWATDVSEQFRNGTFFRMGLMGLEYARPLPRFQEVDEIVGPYLMEVPPLSPRPEQKAPVKP